MHKAKETRKSVFLARLNKLVWDSTATLTPAERRTSEPGFDIRETRKGKFWMEEKVGTNATGNVGMQKM
jgi:hypothetical protein